MRRLNTFRLLYGLVAGIVLAAIPISAQTIKEAVYADFNRAGGVYYMYPFKDHKVSAPPKGYTPVYLSHYGRHGARYLLNATQYERSVGVLDAAHKAGVLTGEGERVWAIASEYYNNVCHNHFGDLSPLGWEQHIRVAREVYMDNRAFFRKRPEVRAGASQTPRSIVSMASFCQGLLKLDPRLDITQSADVYDMDEMCPHHDTNPWREVEKEEGYFKRKDPWGTDLKAFIEKRLDYRAIVARLFKSPEFLKDFRGDRAFVLDFFNLVFNMQCTPTESSLMDVFTPDEKYALWEIDNYIYWVANAPGSSLRDLPTLAHIVEDADSALAAGKPGVRLRFGHDTVFLFLISAFGADGFDIIPDNADGISANWYNFRSPMAATMYLLFCTNRNGDVIFKLVVNGDEATLPLEPVNGPWYRWEDMKAMLSARFSYS